MFLYLWAVTVQWTAKKKAYEAKLDIVAYTVSEAAELGVARATKGIEVEGRYFPPSQTKRARAITVNQRCSIDAICDLREAEPIVLTTIGDLELGTRAQNILATLRISTLEELCQKSREDLLAARSSGDGTVNEIERAMSLGGLVLAEHDDRSEEAEATEEEPEAEESEGEE